MKTIYILIISSSLLCFSKPNRIHGEDDGQYPLQQLDSNKKLKNWLAKFNLNISDFIDTSVIINLIQWKQITEKELENIDDFTWYPSNRKFYYLISNFDSKINQRKPFYKFIFYNNRLKQVIGRQLIAQYYLEMCGVDKYGGYFEAIDPDLYNLDILGFLWGDDQTLFQLIHDNQEGIYKLFKIKMGIEEVVLYCTSPIKLNVP